MANAVADTPVVPTEPGLRGRIVDTARRVAHLSHEARMLKSVTSDAIEDGVYKARRAVTTTARDLSDARDTAAHRIKQSPLKSVGVAFGAGLFVGIVSGAIGWLAIRAVGRSNE